MRWKRHRKLVFLLVGGFLILTVGFGQARVSAITSSERHTTTAFVSDDIRGFGDLFDDSKIHEIAITYDPADYALLPDRTGRGSPQGSALAAVRRLGSRARP